MDITEGNDQYNALWKYIYDRAKDDQIYYQVFKLRGKIPDGECLLRLLMTLKKEKDVIWDEIRRYQLYYPNPPIMKADPNET